jgi:hypothetical protein
MATTVANASNPARSRNGLPGRRYDHWFFSVMAFLMLGKVFVGFARTYYLAGVFRAPLPSLTVHIHGATFSCWIILLIMQTSLVSAGRVDVHRRFGIGGFLLACLMVVLGVLVATGSLARAAGPARRDAQTFYIIPITDMLIFATLIFFAVRARFNPPAHKRLILVATTALLTAAVARWPFAFVSRHAPAAALLTYIFLLILVAYDLWSMHKVHRATVWAIAFLVFVQQIRLPIGRTATWHAFAAWVQSHGH